ncbi:MAG: 4-hydroxy-tetrahydrodipicolinate synthase [Nitrospirae bacterium RBG_19FT_COMBO_42_15]|nr:MAG: 4-hydroxy-tetrahydrodipicolinate synthase [Nitrospirae bacterium RBG_19FT_COMBO_42_15]
MFKGSMVAIVTPFKNGKVDEKALGDLIEFQILNGTDGIVPCGTTGESATLSYEEHNRVIEFTIESVKRRVPVIAGTGSNSTDEAIMLTRHAKKAKADAALLITPYYNKPTQEGLYRHYKKIAEDVDIPLVLYNVPGRTGVNMLPQTVARLSEIKNIVAIKEATGSLQQISETIQLCGERIAILSGDDFTALPTYAVGGKGVISVTANIIPKDMSAMWDAFEKGDLKEANRLHYKTFNLHGLMFCETNPIPVKTALSLMGKCTAEFRLPLCPMSDANLEKLKKGLKEYGLI